MCEYGLLFTEFSLQRPDNFGMYKAADIALETGNLPDQTGGDVVEMFRGC